MEETKQSSKRKLRLVSRDEGFKIITKGHRVGVFEDLYAFLLSRSWKGIIAVTIILFFGLNLLFGTLYFLDLDEIANARVGHFQDAFFFSVQTLATIGYGAMAPKGIWPNILVTIESMLGFAYYGLVTGLMFAKFSSPSARVLFSDTAIIRDYGGVPHLMMRLVNERNNRIVNASAKVAIMRDEKFGDGSNIRRLHDIKLARSEMPFLRLTWVLMHKIDQQSPLFGLGKAELEAIDAEIVVSITGLDETFSQTVHAQHSYIPDEIEFNRAFIDMIERRHEDYAIEIDYSKLSETRDL